MSPESPRSKVVYLFGAGASHACVMAAGLSFGILMRDLSDPLREKVEGIVADKYPDEPTIAALVNAVITDDADVEHIITFLDQSISSLHKRFAEDLRVAFESVLGARLERIEEELGGPPVNLYEAVLDLHQVEGVGEELTGMLTLNCDQYIEAAIALAGREVDLGIDLGQDAALPAYTLLKLHGSFGWKHSWLVSLGAGYAAPLWIPPGIQKKKDDYPFNLLWGRARELLDCDVLRIVGCRLGPNDWDLISLLFTTRHTNARRDQAYRIEVINSPKTVVDLQERHPYLDVSSFLEQEPVGSRLISELLGGVPRPYSSLTPEALSLLNERGTNANWFRLWLIHTAEAIYEAGGSLATPRGVLRGLMEARWRGQGDCPMDGNGTSQSIC